MKPSTDDGSWIRDEMISADFGDTIWRGWLRLQTAVEMFDLMDVRTS